MRIVIAVVLALMAVPLQASAPRVSFMRTIAPEHDPGASDVAVIYARGNRQEVDRFLEEWIGLVDSGRALTLADLAVRSAGPDPKADEAVAARVRHSAPAGAYLGVDKLACTSVERSGESSAHDVDGRRFWRKTTWVEASCIADISVLTSQGLQRVDAFTVRGEGTSPRKPEVDAESRALAIGSALRYAARSATDAIAPRRVRETVMLDESAPQFEDGVTFIETYQLDRARRIWEDAWRARPGSAAIRFNLGAVCEALGDIQAAGEHYRAATKMRPQEGRYAIEYEAFRRRHEMTGRRQPPGVAKR